MFWELLLLGFLAGSVPFSVIVGHLAGGGDIRQVGDGNPGATNVGRSLGWRWFIVAMLLDSFKGAIPVGLARFQANLTGWQLILVAIAPVLGHAFSPWLKFRGGKAVATTFGIWAGLTLWAAPVIFGSFLAAFYAVVRTSGWALLLAFSAFGMLLGVMDANLQAEFRLLWILNAVILVIKHISDLVKPPGLRPWLIRFFKIQ